MITVDYSMKLSALLVSVTFNTVIDKCDMHTVELGLMSLHVTKLLMITCMGLSSYNG